MRKLLLLLFGLALLLAVGQAEARRSYGDAFTSRYPSSPLNSDTCTICHGNPYGTAYKNAGHTFTGNAADDADADGDGFNNKTEIDVGTYPGNSSSKPAAATIPVPAGQFMSSYPMIDVPLPSIDLAQAMPIGLGPIITDGLMIIQTNIGPYAQPVDFYLLLFAPDFDPINIYAFTAADTLTVFDTAAILPWRTGASLNESLFGGASIPVSILPAGAYYFGLLVTPAGDASLANYDLFVTLHQKL